MSEIISNPTLERDMTDNFLCVIYFRDRNQIDVRNNGMDPYHIGKILRYKAFDKKVVPVILNRLIFNNEQRKFLTFNPVTQRVLLTAKGRRWADIHCRNRAGVFG